MKPSNSIRSLSYLALLVGILGLLGGEKTCTAFQPARQLPTAHGAAGCRHENEHNRDRKNHRFDNGCYGRGGADAASSSTFRNGRSDRSVRLEAGILDGVRGFFKKFTTRASASHILIKGGAEAAIELEDLKDEIGESPVKFAAAASRYSECPSSSRGGDLGSFGPGSMVKEFDQVVFNDDIGVVHGPIKTQFGYHLIYIRERTE